MKKNQKPPIRCELLAPAGGGEALMAAFDAGADAVYLGIKRFNVRDRTENFSFKDLERVIPYAHRIGKKVYITFNSILKEVEMVGAMKALAVLNEIGPDALIVSDWGLIDLISKNFPQIKVHASTQMSVHNRLGLKFLADHGVKRVILAREITIDELRLLSDTSPLELEVFAHGALCFAYGGQCLASSYHGGRSANRGMCVQSCRRLFHWETAEGPQRGTLFSASDLQTLKHVPAFKRMGIHSLKIEGRQRTSEYVYKAVRAYRIALDAPEADFAPALKEANRIVQSDMGRKKTDGHLASAEGKNVVQMGLSGNTGIWCGRVDSVRDGKMRFTSPVKLRPGDRLRVHFLKSGDGDGMRLARFDSQPNSGGKGTAYVIPAPEKTAEGDFIYKIGSASFQAQSHAFRKGYAALAEATDEKRRVSLTVNLESDAIGLILEGEDGNRFEEIYSVEILPSDKPLDASVFAQYLARVGDTPFRLGETVFHPSPTAPNAGYIPPKRLKEIRRVFFQEASSQWKEGPINAVGPRRFEVVERFKKEFRQAHSVARPVSKDGWAIKAPAPISRRQWRAYLEWTRIFECVDEIIVPMNDWMDEILAKKEDLPRGLRLALPLIAPPGAEAELARRVQRYWDRGVDRFLLGHISQIGIFDSMEGVGLGADTHFNLMNHRQFSFLADQGLQRAAFSMECDRKIISAVARVPLEIETEMVIHGTPPIFLARMISGAHEEELELASDRGERYRVSREDDLTVVRHAKPMNTARFVKEMKRLGVGRFRLDLTAEECKTDFIKRVLGSANSGKAIPGATSFNYEFGIA